MQRLARLSAHDHTVSVVNAPAQSRGANLSHRFLHALGQILLRLANLEIPEPTQQEKQHKRHDAEQRVHPVGSSRRDTGPSQQSLRSFGIDRITEEFIEPRHESTDDRKKKRRQQHGTDQLEEQKFPGPVTADDRG